MTWIKSLIFGKKCPHCGLRGGLVKTDLSLHQRLCGLCSEWSYGWEVE